MPFMIADSAREVYRREAFACFGSCRFCIVPPLHPDKATHKREYLAVFSKIYDTIWYTLRFRINF